MECAVAFGGASFGASFGAGLGGVFGVAAPAALASAASGAGLGGLGSLGLASLASGPLAAAVASAAIGYGVCWAFIDVKVLSQEEPVHAARCARSPAPGAAFSAQGGRRPGNSLLSVEHARWIAWSATSDAGTGSLPPYPSSTPPRRPRPERTKVRRKPRPGPLRNRLGRGRRRPPGPGAALAGCPVRKSLLEGKKPWAVVWGSPRPNNFSGARAVRERSDDVTNGEYKQAVFEFLREAFQFAGRSEALRIC